MSERRPFTPPKIVSIPIPKEVANPLFSLGQIVITPGALELLRVKGVHPVDFITLHEYGDWGTLDVEDKAANDAAVNSGARVFSAYMLGEDRLWVITDATDDDGVRRATTLLLPQEY